jgi:hypothetical protein
LRQGSATRSRKTQKWQKTAKTFETKNDNEDCLIAAK